MSTNTLNQYTDVLTQSGTVVGSGSVTNPLEKGGSGSEAEAGGLVLGSGSLTDTGSTDSGSVDTGSLAGRILYDSNGNIIGNMLNLKREYEYSYDYNNRLILVSRYNTVNEKEVLISFEYDTLGRRTNKRVQNQLTEYIYSGNDIIEETLSTVNPTSGVKVKKEMREYTYGRGGTDDIVNMTLTTYERVKKVDQVKTTAEYYYEKDHLGSVIRISSSTGGIIDEYSYTVFGKAYKKNPLGVYKPMTSIKSAIGNTRLFTGREYAREAGLYYLRARYYDPSLGRFISRDPIGMRDNVNLYGYVGNSTVMYTDVFGRAKVILNAIQNSKSVQIDLVARRLDFSFLGIPTGKVGAHSFIEFTITDNSGSVGHYSISGNDVKDKLLTFYNDANDVGWKEKKDRYPIIVPRGMTDKEFATNIVNEALIYDQEIKDYALSSADDGFDTEGNCHNYSTTMLMRASSYSPSMLRDIQIFNPSGGNPGMGEYFEPVCIK